MTAHLNRHGVTLTFKATRNHHAFQICIGLWHWNAWAKGPSIMLLTPRRVECISPIGYQSHSY